MLENRTPRPGYEVEPVFFSATEATILPRALHPLRHPYDEATWDDHVFKGPFAERICRAASVPSGNQPIAMRSVCPFRNG
jgi:hypothetical protein